MDDNPTKERTIPRATMMAVLDRNLELAGVKLTVRRYNTILAELGYSLDEIPPPPYRTFYDMPTPVEDSAREVAPPHLLPADAIINQIIELLADYSYCHRRLASIRDEVFVEVPTMRSERLSLVAKVINSCVPSGGTNAPCDACWYEARKLLNAALYPNAPIK